MGLASVGKCAEKMWKKFSKNSGTPEIISEVIPQANQERITARIPLVLPGRILLRALEGIPDGATFEISQETPGRTPEESSEGILNKCLEESHKKNPWKSLKKLLEE